MRVIDLITKELEGKTIQIEGWSHPIQVATATADLDIDITGTEEWCIIITSKEGVYSALDLGEKIEFVKDL